MATAARVTANRANSTLSTGPADTVRTRFNGVNHGLTSKQTVIPGESQQEYDEFHTGLLNHFAPGSAVEAVLAERCIGAALASQALHPCGSRLLDQPHRRVPRKHSATPIPPWPTSLLTPVK